MSWLLGLMGGVWPKISSWVAAGMIGLWLAGYLFVIGFYGPEQYKDGVNAQAQVQQIALSEALKARLKAEAALAQAEARLEQTIAQRNHDREIALTNIHTEITNAPTPPEELAALDSFLQRLRDNASARHGAAESDYNASLSGQPGPAVSGVRSGDVGADAADSAQIRRELPGFCVFDS